MSGFERYADYVDELLGLDETVDVSSLIWKK